MKTLLIVLALAVAAPLANVGCASRPPSARVVEVQTLKSIGQAAEQTLVLSARLYHDGKITAKLAREVLDTYDKKFQPAFRLAKNAVMSDMESAASPEVLKLYTELASLIAAYK